MSAASNGRGGKGGAPAPSATATATATGRTLSSKVMQMKFMQRREEATIRKQAEQRQVRARQTAEWVKPPSASATPATPATPASAASASAATPAQSSTSTTSTTTTSTITILAADEDDEREGGMGRGSTSIASFAVGRLPNSFGRRVFGGFNPTLQRTLDDAAAQVGLAEAVADDVRAVERESKMSISDEAMAEHYAKNDLVRTTTPTTTARKRVANGAASASSESSGLKRQRTASPAASASQHSSSSSGSFRKPQQIL